MAINMVPPGYLGNGPRTGAVTGLRPPVRPVTPNILQRIQQGHPNWFPTGGGGTPPTPQPSPAPAPAGTPAPAPAAPAMPDLSNGKWLGYLTPDQLNNLNQAGYQYTQGVGDWTQSETNANANYTNATGQAQYEHDVNQRQTNEDAAARGLFDSSIRANDLTDLNRTLVDKQTAAKATLDSLIGEATRAITALNSSWGSTQMLYQGIAAQNATPLEQPAPPAPAPAPAPPTPAMTAPPSSGRPTILGRAENAHPSWFRYR